MIWKKTPCSYLGVVFLSLVFLACDGGDEGNGPDAGVGGDGGDIPDAGDPGAALLRLSGQACNKAIEYVVPGGDARIEVYVDEVGDIKKIMVLDGPVFNPARQEEWSSYAAQYDTWLRLTFTAEQPPMPVEVTSIYDSFFAARGFGYVLFYEYERGRVTIESIDMDARTLEVSFDIDVSAGYTDYPPDLAQPQLCEPPSALTGTIAGPFELLAL